MYKVYDAFGNLHGAYRKLEDARDAAKRINGKIEYEWRA